MSEQIATMSCMQLRVALEFIAEGVAVYDEMNSRWSAMGLSSPEAQVLETMLEALRYGIVDRIHTAMMPTST